MDIVLPTLDIRSVLHVVEENFDRFGHKAFAQRMIIIGEHKLSKDELIKNMRTTVSDVNSGYCPVTVRGFLLAYDTYFVHIVEGSEDTIHRHLRFLFKQEENLTEQIRKDLEAKGEEGPKGKWSMFPRLKMLMVYHSITTLYFEDWHAVKATPPSLISTLDAKGPFSEHMEQLRICLDKIARMCEIARQNKKMTEEQLRAADPKMEALPESQLLDYLLKSEHILDLRYVVHLYRRVDDHVFYFEKVWPQLTHFTPSYLYKLKIDDSFVEPLPVMPWEIQKEDEEEKDEERSGTSTD